MKFGFEKQIKEFITNITITRERIVSGSESMLPSSDDDGDSADKSVELLGIVKARCIPYLGTPYIFFLCPYGEGGITNAKL